MYVTKYPDYPYITKHINDRLADPDTCGHCGSDLGIRRDPRWSHAHIECLNPACMSNMYRPVTTVSSSDTQIS